MAFVQTNCLANVLGCLRGILCFSFFLVVSTTDFQWKQSFHHFWKCTKPAKRLINMLRCKRNRKMSEMSPISACFQTQYEDIVSDSQDNLPLWTNTLARVVNTPSSCDEVVAAHKECLGVFHFTHVKNNGSGTRLHR